MRLFSDISPPFSDPVSVLSYQGGRRKKALDKLLVFSSGESILLKKVKPEIYEKSIEDILMPLREKAETRGLSEADVEKEIKSHRARQR